MKDFKDLTTEDLEQMDKKVLITIIGALQKQLKSIDSQLNFLTEQIALMNQRSFGRKSETVDSMQLTFADVFNEIEFKSDDSDEPEISEIVVSTYTRKKKTKREEKLEGLPARIFEHTLSEEELNELFPNGYKELPCETYKRLSIIPQTFMVDEHHVHVYASKDNNGTIKKAKRPADLFRNSIATPSLIAAVMNGKYQNHLPLQRQIACYKDSGIKLEENTLSNWMINASDKYLSVIYDELHNHLYECSVIHADETPFQVIRPDGSVSHQKSYMWVYCNGANETRHPVVLYDYRPGRSHFYPEEFLKEFSGTVVTDGYQAYHTLENKRSDLHIAGCWVHAKRRFAELVKAVGEKNVTGTICAQAVTKISAFFHEDKQFNGLSASKRKKERQLVLKPKVNAFFAWLEEILPSLPAESATAKAINYCLNQEKYLRAFLNDGNIPLDNNAAERAIRPFTLGRKNWVNMFSSNGAQASAVIYSLVETAKANNIRVYDYLELLLTELSQHADEEDTSFIKDLLPWSDHVREKCQNPPKTSINIPTT